MRSQMRKLWFQALALCLPVLTGCLSHTRKLQQPKMPTAVQTADVKQLVDNINKEYDAVQSLTATVDFQASVISASKGKITEYTSFRGYILLRKPEMIRVLGLVPVLHTPAFDMASDGKTFKLLIPPKNKAIVGSNTVTQKSPNPLENMRPNIFVDSLLIRKIQSDELLSLTTDTKTVTDPKQKQLLLQPDYELNVFKQNSNSHILIPVRVIHISRIDLLPYEEDIYDSDGNIQTQAVYGPYQSFGGFRFPGTITIKRPLDAYQIVVTFEKVTTNQPLADNQFELKIPEKTQIQTMK
jgi:outer membrane lipoprotein-sorting protein